MSVLRLYWVPAMVSLLALMTVALLTWPGGVSKPSPSSELRYTGPDFQSRAATPLRTFPIRIGGLNTEATPAPAPQALPMLTGISGGDAYLRSAATGEVQRLARGQSLDGWRLVSVRGRAVVMSNGADEQRLALFSAATNPGGPAGALATPPVQPPVSSSGP